jgi:hypothetical protein
MTQKTHFKKKRVVELSINHQQSQIGNQITDKIFLTNGELFQEATLFV